VVVLAPAAPSASRRVLSLGEAKYGEVMGIKHVERLRRARDLLSQRGYDTREVVLACYSAAGFSRELLSTDDPRLRLIGPDELYTMPQ